MIFVTFLELLNRVHSDTNWLFVRQPRSTKLGLSPSPAAELSPGCVGLVLLIDFVQVQVRTDKHKSGSDERAGAERQME